MPLFTPALPSKLPNISAFANNAVQQSKGLSDPGTQARIAVSSPVAPKIPQQVNTFKSGLQDYSNWSKGITQQTIAAKAAARAAQESMVRLQQQSGSQRPGPNIEQGPGVSLADNKKLLGYSAGTSPARQKIVQTALSKVGTPYAWGGGGYNNPGSRGTGKGTQNVVGVDCSGLVAYSYGQIGVKLPHYSGSQTAMGYKTNIRNAMPGDIVGWNKGGHVAVYVGNGMIAEAPNVGMRVRVRAIRPGEAVYAVRLKLQGE